MNGQFWIERGSLKSKPVLTIVSKRDTLSAHVSTVSRRVETSTSLTYDRIARRLLGRTVGVPVFDGREVFD